MKRLTTEAEVGQCFDKGTGYSEFPDQSKNC